jgi:hypothetical protein
MKKETNPITKRARSVVDEHGHDPIEVLKIALHEENPLLLLLILGETERSKEIRKVIRETVANKIRATMYNKIVKECERIKI